ncbi:MAG TPA: hypothetical protein VIQ02_06305, partial [Jiangellaceae bacterium]
AWRGHVMDVTQYQPMSRRCIYMSSTQCLARGEQPMTALSRGSVAGVGSRGIDPGVARAVSWFG